MSATHLLAALMAATAAAQEPEAAGAPPPAATPQQERPADPAGTAPASGAPAGAAEGVLSYTPDYFAAAQPANAMDMINRVPGFSFDPGDQVRGFAGAAGNVLIDGERPSSKTENLETILRRIPASSVARIELIRGGAPGIDMQGQQVLVNVVRKTDAASTLLLALANLYFPEGGYKPQFRIEATRRSPGRAYEAGLLLYTNVSDETGQGDYYYDDGAGRRLREGTFTNFTPFYGADASGKAEFKLNDISTFRANAALKHMHVDQYEDADWMGAPPEADGFEHLDYGSNRNNAEVGLDYERKLGPRTEAKLVGIQTLRTRVDEVAVEDAEGTLIEFTDDTFAGESILRATGTFRKSETLSFEAGAEGAYNFLEGESLLLVDGEKIDLPAENVKVEEQRGEVFGTATWKISPKLTLEAGSRFEASVLSQTGDTNQEKSFFFPKPRALLTWAPNEQTQVRVRFEREVGQLDFGDFVSSASIGTGTTDVGNPDLEPDRTWVFETAFERRFWEKGAFVVTYTHGEIEQALDLIPIFDPDDPTIFFDAPGNIGDGKRDTLELNLTLPLDRLGVKGGLLRTWRVWNTSEVIDPVTGETRRISGQHPYDWEMRFSQDLPKWKSVYGLEAYGSFQETFYRTDEVQQFEFDTYWMAYYEWKPRPAWSLRWEVHNITNRERRLIRTLYDGPRDTGAIEAIETRTLPFDPFFYFRIRRTVG